MRRVLKVLVIGCALVLGAAASAYAQIPQPPTPPTPAALDPVMDLDPVGTVYSLLPDHLVSPLCSSTTEGTGDGPVYVEDCGIEPARCHDETSYPSHAVKDQRYCRIAVAGVVVECTDDHYTFSSFWAEGNHDLACRVVRTSNGRTVAGCEDSGEYYSDPYNSWSDRSQSCNVGVVSYTCTDHRASVDNADPIKQKSCHLEGVPKPHR